MFLVKRLVPEVHTMLDKRMGILLVLILGIVVACSLPTAGAPSGPAQPSAVPPALLTAAVQTAVAVVGQGKPTEIPPALLTAAAGTAVAALTQNAPASPPPSTTALPTVTLTSTLTPTPTLTPAPTLTPTQTLTPTPSTPHISVSVNTNCRTGPGDAYERVGALLVGKTAEVLARDPYGQFWYIPNPQRPGQFCWVWGQYATIAGETASLPVFTPPPTPTPAPDFLIKRVTLVFCGGTPAYFLEVSNTGRVTWESYRLGVDDLTTSLQYGGAANNFVQTATCASLALFSLTPAHGAFVPFSSGAINAADQLRFTLTLYAQDGQAGQHVTHTIDYP